MLMEQPVTPSELADLELNRYMDHFIKTLNRFIKSNLKYSPSCGPMACFSVKNIFIHHLPSGEDIFFPITDGLFDKILKQAIKIYESVGWTVYDDLKDYNKGERERYLTFSSKIWKEDK